MISPIMHQLFDGVSASDLASWIAAERTDHFGLGPGPDGDAELAARLTQWWVERIADDSR
jgi:hypothetical protein